MPESILKHADFISQTKPIVTRGELRLIEWSEHERKVRALKWGGLCFGAGLVSVIFPLVHFVLVPGFILASPFLAMAFYKQRTWLTGGEGPCPNCGKPLKIGSSKPLFPLYDLCTSCRTEIRIELTS